MLIVYYSCMVPNSISIYRIKDWKTPSFLPRRAGEGKWNEQQGKAVKSLT